MLPSRHPPRWMTELTRSCHAAAQESQLMAPRVPGEDWARCDGMGALEVKFVAGAALISQIFYGEPAMGGVSWRGAPSTTFGGGGKGESLKSRKEVFTTT